MLLAKLFMSLTAATTATTRTAATTAQRAASEHLPTGIFYCKQFIL